MGLILYKGFLERKDEILPKERVVLLLHSPGGHINWAYKIVRLFQKRTDEFFTIVPLYAKSAATLIAIGGKQIIMGSEGKLGPLDV
jgi:ClpP class serine protease